MPAAPPPPPLPGEAQGHTATESTPTGPCGCRSGAGVIGSRPVGHGSAASPKFQLPTDHPCCLEIEAPEEERRRVGEEGEAAAVEPFWAPQRDAATASRNAAAATGGTCGEGPGGGGSGTHRVACMETRFPHHFLQNQM